MYDRIVDGGLSVRKVEDIVRAAGRNFTRPAATSGSGDSASLHSLEERLQQALGTKVKVHTKGNGRGDIVIEFYSLDDFDRLLDLFTDVKK
jgi:ParB family chromosome partitioning protein